MQQLTWSRDIIHGSRLQTTQVDRERWMISYIAGSWYWGTEATMANNPPKDTEKEAKQAVEDFIRYGEKGPPPVDTPAPA